MIFIYQIRYFFEKIKNIFRKYMDARNKYEEIDIINEFKYNISKKNIVREGLFNIIHNLNSKNSCNQYLIEKILSEGYSYRKIYHIFNKYDFKMYNFEGDNFLKIYNIIDSSNILEVINDKCKITEDKIDKMSSTELSNLFQEFNNIHNFTKPTFYSFLVKKYKVSKKN